MALKSDRYVLQTDISFFLNEVAERGVIVSLSTGGSGVALDNQGTTSSPFPLAVVSANPSGVKPIGFLMNDMVSIDTTRYHLNFHKDEVDMPGKVTILRKGWVLTDKVTGGLPAAFDKAYLGGSGLLQKTQGVGGEVQNPTVGQFLSTVDEDGYTKVEINLP